MLALSSRGVGDGVVVAAVVATGPAGNAFYTPPSPLPAATARDVDLGAAAHDERGASERGFQHARAVSHDGRGRTDRAVSGTVAIPKGTPPAGGWPVISWAHGTTGDAPSCTPSLDTAAGPVHDYLGPIEITLDKAVAAGYAVVQTDYEGQGTPGVHPYLIGVAEARDTIDMVRAARQIAPQLSSRWVVMGHSQGGHAALFTTTAAAAWAPELQLLGGVAEAPAAYISPFIASLSKGPKPTPSFAFGALFIEAASSVDPSVKLEQIFAPAALAMVPQLLNRCSGALYGAGSWGGLVPAASFRSDAVMAPLLRVAAQNDAGPLRPAVPVFIAQGSTDTTVPQASSDALDKALCANGATVRYDVYQGLGHRPVVPAAMSDALEWVGARFAGQRHRERPSRTAA